MAAMRAGARLRHSPLALDADEDAAELLGDRARRARAEERIEHHIARLGGGEQHAMEQRFGLLGRMKLAAVGRS